MRKRKKNTEDITQAEKINLLEKGIDELNKLFAKKEIHELLYVLGSKKEILKRNLLAGIARGIGAGIGITIITAIIIYFLQKIVKLNIPVIGKYITDIIEIIEKTK